MKSKAIKEKDIPVSVVSTDNVIFIPISTAMAFYVIKTGQPVEQARQSRKLMMPVDVWEKYPISSIKVEVNEEQNVVNSAQVVDYIIKRKHSNILDYNIVIPSEILRFKQNTQRIFSIVMGAIAGISLLVGGIGIMNIMLATITNRIKEIGIRRCIGATRKEILIQFLIECLLLTIIGGFIGIFLGALAAKIIAVYAKWKTIISMKAILLSFGVALLTGILFGMYPAKKASEINPIEALRHE